MAEVLSFNPVSTSVASIEDEVIVAVKAARESLTRAIEMYGSHVTITITIDRGDLLNQANLNA